MDLIIQPSADSKRIPSGEQMMIPSGGQGKRKQRSCDDQSANEQRNPQVEQATLPTQDEGSRHVRNSASDHAVSSKVSKPKCIRILGIPKDWSETDLLDALETSEWSLKDTKHDISLYPACCGDNLTALLSLESHAGIFERLKPHDVTYVPVTAASGSETILTIDSRFYDLTPLNTPKGEIIADVVAVTGLVGHAFGSWRNRDTNKMWLKDFLPIDVQGFRIMTYGYNSNLIGNIVDDTVVDYRRQFIHTLCNARRGIEDRPIIFIGHGLGGILILQALLHCRNGRQYKQLFAATHAILFFGTPHQGMEVEELCAMVKDASPRATSKYEILRDLERSSNFLNTQREDITNLWDSTLMIDILSFYETKKTRTVRKSASGSWGRNGEHVEMVKKNSAQLFWPSEHRIPVPSDNIGMVKFGSRDDNTYQTVLTHMIRWKDSLIGRHELAKKKAKLTIMGEHKKILDWLSLNDTNSRHNDIRNQRQEGTGKWFLETETFRQWIQGSSDESQRLLWAYGIPGAGKTCISSLVIDHLHEHASKKNCGVAHIYFNYKEKQKQRPTDILTSLVKQLGNQQPEPSVVLLGLHERSQKEKRRPTDDELYNALVGLSKEFTRTFVVFDALDECDRWEQRATLLPMCHKMRESGLTLFITSRRSADDIEESFKEASTMEIRAHEADIRSYICKRLDAHPAARSMLRNSKREEGIITELVEISAGMFLFVGLNIEHLCRQPTVGHIRRELQTLRNPPSKDQPLDQIYDRIMKSLKEQSDNSAAMALNVLCWLTKARRTLTIDELRTAIAVEPNTTELDEEFVPIQSKITDVCAGLVVVDAESGTVRLAHFTVQEYLIRKNIIPPEADSTLATACATYLAFDVFRDGACGSQEAMDYRLNSYPFLRYAAPNLAVHIRSCKQDLTKEAFSRLLENTDRTSTYVQAAHCSEGGPWWNYPRGWRAQHVASYVGHIIIMRLLIDNGADVSAASNDGLTPLHFAAREGHEEIATLLIDKGANVSAANIYGSTSLHEALRNGHEQIARLLIDKGANLSTADVNGWTPLHEALKSGHEGIARLLIDKGVNLSAADVNGWTPLHEALKSGHEEIARLLIDKGANLSAADVNGWTLLQEALKNGHEAIARLLIERGANITTASRDRKTPLHIAEQCGWPGCSDDML